MSNKRNSGKRATKREEGGASSISSKSPAPIDFVNDNLPRHSGLVKLAQIQQGHWTPPAPTERKAPTLYEAYMRSDPRMLVHDLSLRPDHYTKDQAETIRKLGRGEACRERELNDLVLQYMQTTKARELNKAITTKYTAPQGIAVPVFEEPGKVAEALNEETPPESIPFEQQEEMRKKITFE